MTSGIYPLNRGRQADLEINNVRAYLANLRIVSLRPAHTAGAPIRGRVAVHRLKNLVTLCERRGIFFVAASGQMRGWPPTDSRRGLGASTA
jgi:hypothetical protein